MIYTLVVGLIVGAVAKFLTPGRDPGGCIITILLGIGGSFVGGYIGSYLGLYSSPTAPVGFGMSVVGAIVLLLVYRMLFGKK